MLNLTDKEVRNIGEKRYLAINNPLFYTLLALLVIGFMLFIISSDADYTSGYNNTYQEVNSDKTITIEYNDGLLTIDNIAYNKIDSRNTGLITSVEIMAGLTLITGIIILAYLLINADKQGKKLLQEYKDSNKPCEMP